MGERDEEDDKPKFIRRLKKEGRFPLTLDEGLWLCVMYGQTMSFKLMRLFGTSYANNSGYANLWQQEEGGLDVNDEDGDWTPNAIRYVVPFCFGRVSTDSQKQM
jgi:hypothetical protein